MFLVFELDNRPSYVSDIDEVKNTSPSSPPASSSMNDEKLLSSPPASELNSNGAVLDTPVRQDEEANSNWEHVRHKKDIVKWVVPDGWNVGEALQKSDIWKRIREENQIPSDDRYPGW
jgi:hypothetical protein